MEQRNITTYRLREQCGFDNKAIRRLKANENTETKTLNKICTFLDCRIEDIMEYIPDWFSKGDVNETENSGFTGR